MSANHQPGIKRFDLSEFSKEAKRKELILEALHSLFTSRLDDKIIPLSSDVRRMLKIIF